MAGDAAQVPPAAPSSGVRSLVSRRHVVMGAMFAGISGAGLALTPQPTLKPMARGTVEKWMPDRVGPWTFESARGVLLPPADATSDRLYDNVVARAYSARDLPSVMLLVAYSATQDGMLQVHRPEFCYVAGGRTLTKTQDVTVTDAGGKRYGANTFVASGIGGEEQVLYWTRIGSAFPQSWIEQRAAIMRANLHGRIPDGLLARVSLPLNDGSDALPSLQAFIAELDRAASPQLRALLFGARAATTA